MTKLTESSPSAASSTAHPRGLYVLFATEMWERFSYYGMRALLVLYLVNALGYKRTDALEMYGIYTGLVYLTPIFGGWIADKYLGMRLTAVIGGTVMMLGHFAMAVPSLLDVALGLLIVGNGFFKPNTTSMVGELYSGPTDPRRDGAYTIFYMGINLGSFFSGLVCGTLGEKLGWDWGFASAGVGMAIGLATLIAFQGILGRSGLKPNQGKIGAHNLPIVVVFTVASIALVYGVLAVWPAIKGLFAGLPGWLSIVIGVAVIAAAMVTWSKLTTKPGVATKPLTKAEWTRVAAVLILVVFVAFFWMGFEQAGGSMNLFADKQTDRHLGSFEIPSTWFQSINPLLIILLAPVFSMIWTTNNKSPLSDSRRGQAGPGHDRAGPGLRRDVRRAEPREPDRARRPRVAVLGVRTSHHRRADAVAGGAVVGVTGGAAPHRRAADGRLVHRQRHRQLFRGRARRLAERQRHPAVPVPAGRFDRHGRAAVAADAAAQSHAQVARSGGSAGRAAEGDAGLTRVLRGRTPTGLRRVGVFHGGMRRRGLAFASSSRMS